MERHGTGVFTELLGTIKLGMDSARMNQDRTFFVSGFFLELPFSSSVCSRLRSVPSTSM
jgi:hypothetical protein